MYTDLTNLCIGPESSIQNAVARMDVSRVGIVLVVDSEMRLQGTITDGDVRRAILANIGLDASMLARIARRTSPSVMSGGLF